MHSFFTSLISAHAAELFDWIVLLLCGLGFAAPTFRGTPRHYTISGILILIALIITVIAWVSQLAS
jgi:hypothetical protein